MKKILTLSLMLLAAVAAMAQSATDYRAAAEQGDARAQYMLGQCYEKGLGTEVDSVQAAYWYTKAADQDDPDALYSLGICYYYAIGVPENLPKARTLLRKAIATGKLDTMKAYTANALMGHFEIE